MDLVRISDLITYLPASESPLSADVVVIRTSECNYIYDVGASKEAEMLVNAIAEKKKCIISHFHQDHMGNLGKVKLNTLYVSKYTQKHVGSYADENIYGKVNVKILDEGLVLNDKEKIQIIPFPSSHAKGCLALKCQDWLFVGDALYPQIKKGGSVYNVQYLKQQIDLINKIDCRYICKSHELNKINSKEEVMCNLCKMYGNREKNMPYICI